MTHRTTHHTRPAAPTLRTLALRALALAAAIGLLAGGPAVAEDQIYDLTGNILARGTVTNMSAVSVVISSTAGDRTIPANEIRNIVYDDDTGESRTVKTRVFSQQLEQALEEIGKLNPADYKRPEVLADIEFYRAYCLAKLSLQGSANKTDAARALVAFIGKHTTSYHLFEAAELVGDVSQAMGRFDISASYYQKLAAAPWPEAQMRGLVLEAGALIAQEKYADASQRYAAAIAKPADNPQAARQQLLAKLGKAYCDGLAGQPDEGIAVAEQVIKENDSQDSELFARAYNTLGVCHYKAGRDKDALMAFLHTHLMFTSDANSHAEALYYLTQLWDKLEHSDRALKTRTLLKSRYAMTSWANK